MDSSPITALAFKEKLFFAQSCLFFFPGGNILFDSPILAIKFINRNALLVMKRKLTIFCLDTNTMQHSIVFETNIADVYVNTTINVLLMNGEALYYELLNNEMKVISKKSIFEKTIITATVTEDTCFIGSFESIYVVSMDNKTKICYSNAHCGRIFDLCIADNLVFSCGDDRKICANGVTIIQEYRDSFFKLEFSDKMIYTLNRDGYFRVYKNNSITYDLIYSKFFGTTSLQTMLKANDSIYITTKNGCVYSYKNAKFKLIFGQKIVKPGLRLAQETIGDCKLYNTDVIYSNGVITYKEHSLEVPSKPIDCVFNKDTFYLLFSDHLEIYSNICKELIKTIYKGILNLTNKTARISVYTKQIYLYNENIVYIGCSEHFNLLKTIKIKNINIVKCGIIGTKNGCIYLANTLIKLSLNPITDILVKEQILYVLDNQNVLYKCRYNELSEVLRLKHTDMVIISKDVCHPCTDSDYNINKQERAGESYYEVNNDTKEKLSTVRAKTTENTSKDNSNSEIARTSHELYLLKTVEVTLKDTIYLPGHFVYRKYNTVCKKISIILSEENSTYLEAYKNSIRTYNIIYDDDFTYKYFNFTAVLVLSNLKLIGTDHGQVFLLKSNKITDYVSLMGSVVGIYNVMNTVIVFTKIGVVYTVEFEDEIMFIIREKNLVSKISCCYENIACLSNGDIIELDTNLNILDRKQTAFFISCIYKNFISFSGYIAPIEKNVLSKSYSNNKIGNRNIFTIRQFNEEYLAAGDDHKIYSFNKNQQTIKSTLIHSAQIHDIVVCRNFICVLSSDMRICVLDHNLEIVKYIKHTVRSPKTLLFADSILTIFGESIQEIYIDC